MSIIAPGTDVPEFTLKTEDGEPFTRDDLVGKTTVFVFYPFAFSSVCTDQFQIYQEVLEDFVTPSDSRNAFWLGEASVETP